MPYAYRGNRRTVEAVDRCPELRREMTDAERRLWRILRGRQVAGAKFRRQHEYGPYILDFFCPERRLAIEVDGGQHLTPEGLARDTKRDSYLSATAIQVLRFTDREMLLETEAVRERIRQVLEAPAPQRDE